MVHSSASGRSARWPSTAWELVRRAREGRKEAMEELLSLYYPPVRRFFGRVLRVKDPTLHDLTQEFFARFLEKDYLKTVTREESFRGFLKVACRRHYLKWRMSEARRQRKTGGRISQAEPPIAPAETDAAFQEELRAWYLEEGIRRVREEARPDVFAIFEARMKGEKYESLAERFGKHVFDVRNDLTAARKILRRALFELAETRADDPRAELEELGLLKYVE